MIDKDGYRKNIGIILCNSKNELLNLQEIKRRLLAVPSRWF